MNTYRCLVCGYIYTGDAPPESCPICDAPSDQFELIKSSDEGGDKRPMDGGVYEPDLSIKKVVILGSGIAALSAAETLRENRQDIEITMVTAEENLPYYRLNLTKYLADEVTEGNLTIHEQYWYDQQRIQIFKNRIVTEIDRENQCVRSSDGLEVPYDRLIVALGAHAFIPPIKGVHQSGVTCVRMVDEARELKERIKDGTKVLIIGGGVLGLEAAGALNACGAKVTVAEGAQWLMPRQLNKKAADYLENTLKNVGIEVAYEFITDEIRSEEGALVAIASDGRTVVADEIILATGVRPNTYLVRIADLDVDRGLVVNDCMKTSDDLIYAAGDITEHYGVTYGLWTAAQFQGTIAAMNLLGIKTPFGGIPRSNALKVLDIDLFSVGTIRVEDGSYRAFELAEDDRYICFIVRDNMLVGGITIGYGGKAYKLKELVESKTYLSHETAASLESMLALLGV